MFAGLGAARIRVSKRARKHAPSIVFIDELDAVGTARIGGGFHREHDQTLNQLLVELDGFAARDEVVDGRLEPAPGSRHRAAAARPLRQARCSCRRLDVAGREAILAVHTRDKPLDKDVDLAIVARQTAG